MEHGYADGAMGNLEFIMHGTDYFGCISTLMSSLMAEFRMVAPSGVIAALLSHLILELGDANRLYTRVFTLHSLYSMDLHCRCYAAIGFIVSVGEFESAFCGDSAVTLVSRFTSIPVGTARQYVQVLGLYWTMCETDVCSCVPALTLPASFKVADFVTSTVAASAAHFNGPSNDFNVSNADGTALALHFVSLHELSVQVTDLCVDSRLVQCDPTSFVLLPLQYPMGVQLLYSIYKSMVYFNYVYNDICGLCVAGCCASTPMNDPGGCSMCYSLSLSPCSSSWSFGPVRWSLPYELCSLGTVALPDSYLQFAISKSFALDCTLCDRSACNFGGCLHWRVVTAFIVSRFGLSTMYPCEFVPTIYDFVVFWQSVF